MKAGAQRSADRATLGLRSTLIVGEVALAVVLVVAAGLLMRSLWRLTHVDPGFRTAHLLTARVSPSPLSCADRAACIAFYEELLLRARDLPGVTGVAAVNAPPLTGQIPFLPVEFEGQPQREETPLAWAGAVTPDYFQLLGIPVLRGRGFSEADGETTSGVVVVSAETAQRYWPGEDPIGKHIRVVWEEKARIRGGRRGRRSPVQPRGDHPRLRPQRRPLHALRAVGGDQPPDPGGHEPDPPDLRTDGGSRPARSASSWPA